VLEFVQEQEESLLSCENNKYAAMDLMWHVGYYDVSTNKMCCNWRRRNYNREESESQQSQRMPVMFQEKIEW